jgi:mannose-6-phosphate isomerase-like protein (cupin superfamily)
MEAFDLHEVMEAHGEAGRLYHEFFAAPRLSMGLYVLPAGQTDPQSPHTEDEVYVVVKGQGTVQVDGEDRPLKPGSIVYVEQGVAHHFHSITDELTLLVVFAPPRRSQAQPSSKS